MKDRIDHERESLSRMDFRSLVLGVLSDITMKIGTVPKHFIYTKRGEIDISIMKQIMSIPAPIIVEIENKSSSPDISKTASDLISIAKEIDYSSVLIISSKVYEKEKIADLEGRLTSDEVTLKIWDYNRLRDVAVRTSYAAAFVNGSFSLVGLQKGEFKQAIDLSKTENWKQRTDERKYRLKQEYQQGRVVPFLGAGTTYDAMIPEWTDLMRKLVVKVINEQGGLNLSSVEKTILSKRILDKHLDWQLIAGHYVKTALEERYPTSVDEILYGELRQNNGGTSELIVALSEFCIRNTNSQEKAIPAVITYNFDDLLENHLDTIDLSYKIIRSPRDVPMPEDLPIYHVHGCIPVDNREGFATEDEFFVLADEDYQVLNRDPNYWANNAQLHYLREFTGLAIGLSLKDPNLRRLLWIVANENERPRHFMLIKRDSKEEFTEGTTLDEERIETYLKLHYELQEKAFSRIGVNVVWFEDFRELPGIIRFISNQ